MVEGLSAFGSGQMVQKTRFLGKATIKILEATLGRKRKTARGVKATKWPKKKKARGRKSQLALPRKGLIETLVVYI